jgi:hypothetical protein
LGVLDHFNVLILKINFKNKKNIILIYFQTKYNLKNKISTTILNKSTNLFDALLNAMLRPVYILPCIKYISTKIALYYFRSWKKGALLLLWKRQWMIKEIIIQK